MSMQIRGVIAPMTTPFDEQGELEVCAVSDQVNFLIEGGVHALVAGGSGGEGHVLDREEFRSLLEAVVTAADGRVPVVAGVITNSTREAIIRANSIADLPIAAFQVTPVHYLFAPTHDATVRHFAELSDALQREIFIYNVIKWNYLPPELLLRIMREVEFVNGVKQSAGDLKLLSDLLLAAEPNMAIYTAIDALLYPSYTLGAPGSITALLAAIPGSNVQLWDAVHNGDHERALKLHELQLGLWNTITQPRIPSCIKFIQSLQGVPSMHSRAPMTPPDIDQQGRIRRAFDELQEFLG